MLDLGADVIGDPTQAHMVAIDARAPHSLHAPSYSFTFGTSSVASANKTTAAVTPEPQLTIIGLS